MDPVTMAALAKSMQGSAEGLGSIFGGMFGNSAGPYKDATNEYEKWMQYAQGTQMPYYNAGAGGMQNYQNWLGGMQDPSKFVNNLMGGYQESPHAKNLQQEAMRAGQNMGSASGLTGSTPLMQQMQQNAGNISSADQNQWLQHVLGINNQYGQGQQNLMGVGQNAANMLSQLWGQQAGDMSKLKYGQGAGENQDFMSILGGLIKLITGAGGNGMSGGGGMGGMGGGTGGGFPGPRPSA